MTETDIELSDSDLDLDLDTTWMDSTETYLADYTPFYKKDVTRLTIVRAYINLDGEVARVSSNDETLDAPNTLTVRHMYTVTVEEDAVEDMAELDYDDDEGIRDLSDAIQDITIERTIEHFQDVNTLLLLIKETPIDAGMGSAASVLEIELGNANPLSRKNRRHKPNSFGAARTRRLH
jgi:hypothetical protein